MTDSPTGVPVLEVAGLTHRYGDLVAVADLSFQVLPGETYGLLGPNGAGKTTAISMIAGLIPAHEGSVRVLGEPMSPSATSTKRHLGLVPQELAIYPELTARENLVYFGRLQRLRGKELTGRVAEVLELIGLSGRADEASKQFSGGMKRRLNIGIGLLHRPALLILDEPTVGVDPQSRNAILESVEALAVEGMAVLYTTHYMEEAERLCDRVAIVDSGRMQAEGTQDELIRLTGGVDHIRLAGTGDIDSAAGALRGLTAVTEVAMGPRALLLTVHDAPRAVAEVVEVAARSGMTIEGVEVSRPDLEAVFLHLTGKALRD